jgi:hypothetical protein
VRADFKVDRDRGARKLRLRSGLGESEELKEAVYFFDCAIKSSANSVAWFSNPTRSGVELLSNGSRLPKRLFTVVGEATNYLEMAGNVDIDCDARGRWSEV